MSLVLLSLSLAAVPSPNDEVDTRSVHARSVESTDDLAPWSQWRGPARDGQVSGPRWPEDLSAERLVLSWRADEVGSSYSGPIVDGTRVFTTGTVEGEYEVVRAFDRSSGRELWSANWPGAMDLPFFAARNGSWIRATPASDGEALYVAGMCDAVVCLEADSGAVRWHVEMKQAQGTPNPRFGQAASPLVHGDGLFVHAGGAFRKLDRRTGDLLWSALQEADGQNEGAFASPVVARLAGREQVVVQSREELVGLDPQDGEVLWSTPVRAFRGMNILTPLVVGDAIFTTAYGGRAHRFEVSRGSSPEDADFRVASAWNVGVQGYMTSPVLVDGHAYLFLRNNRVTCVDVASGESKWTSPPTGDSYWSLAAQGDRILALADTGVLRLLEATPSEYRVISERQVADGETWAHVAPAGDEIYVRELNSLLAYRWR